jgi:hypothetical protein
MGCNKCGKKSCGCKGSSTGSEGTISQIQNQIDDLTNQVKFLLCGHPILMIQNPNDVQYFDLVTGKGSKCWEGWAVCDGKTHENPETEEMITTPNLIDRFVVMATGTYAVGDTGGFNTVALTANQNGSHTHSVTDPGHTHGVTDPGHTHGVTDPGHTHSGTTAAHNHTFTTNSAGNHSHAIPELVDLVDDGGTGATAANSPVTNGSSGIAGEHSHSGTTDSSASMLTTNSSNTGISTQSAFTGITNGNSGTGITINNSGAGEAHENRPPYYALIFVQKI